MSPTLRDLEQVQQGDMAFYKDMMAYSSSGGRADFEDSKKILYGLLIIHNIKVSLNIILW